MNLPWLEERTPFPPTADALGPDDEAPGLLCAGGSLSLARLRSAYARGIFPWYGNGQPVLWWSPDPRMVLPVADFKLTRSLKKTITRFTRTPGCEVRIDHDFNAVISGCARTLRTGQYGTWIVPELMRAYSRWHDAGEAHSVETWIDGELAGGLYGICLGRMFYGESMFMRTTDASKIALAALVAFSRAHGIELIDCQQHTVHLSSFGAREIPRPTFEAHLQRAVAAPPIAHWTYDPAFWQQLGIQDPGATSLPEIP